MTTTAPNPVALTGVLLTPTGVLLGDWPAQSPDWYAARAAGIGSSDIPAIVGSSAYRTALHVWLDKRGELPPDDVGESATWGTLLEDVIAREFAAREGFTVAEVGTLAHVEHPWRRANLDRLVHGCTPGAGEAVTGCAVEVKTRNAWAAGHWREEVPDDVEAQVQWQLHVTGLDHIHVACLLGGQRLITRVVYPDPTVIDYLISEASALWDAVHTGIAPTIDPGAMLLDLLDRLHPDRTGRATIDRVTAANIRHDYRIAAEAEKAAVEAKDAAKAAFVALLGDAQIAVDRDGKTLATYKADLRPSCDLTLLADNYPDAHAACVTRKPTRPILRFTKEL